MGNDPVSDLMTSTVFQVFWRRALGLIHGSSERWGAEAKALNDDGKANAALVALAKSRAADHIHEALEALAVEVRQGQGDENARPQEGPGLGTV